MLLVPKGRGRGLGRGGDRQEKNGSMEAWKKWKVIVEAENPSIIHDRFYSCSSTFYASSDRPRCWRWWRGRRRRRLVPEGFFFSMHEDLALFGLFCRPAAFSPLSPLSTVSPTRQHGRPIPHSITPVTPSPSHDAPCDSISPGTVITAMLHSPC